VDRVNAVAYAVVHGLADSTVGVVDSWFRRVLDSITRYFDGRPHLGKIAVMQAPTYVKLQSAVGTWRSLARVSAEVLLQSDTSGGLVYPIVEGATGGTLAGLIARSGRKVRSFAAEQKEAELDVAVRVVTDIEDIRVAASGREDFVREVTRLNEVDSAAESRYNLDYARAERSAGETVQAFKFAVDDDPVGSLNQLYLELFPAMANTRRECDTFSLSLDPQDRTLEAPMLRMNSYFGLAPVAKSYYESNLKALNVPKRQNTAPELLTAISARNLSAPVVSLPQEEDVMIRSIWDNFLDTMCVEGAEEKLAEYQDDPVALAEGALNDWASKAKPGVVDRIVAELEAGSKSLGDMDVGDYLVMLKADVKPTLSTKPVGEVTAPQVIVYHEKPLSALYSSLFRVLVRRFLSLLKPNIHVNLLKDSEDVAQFIAANHPFGKAGIKYLENDFSKFDKSQSRFVFKLEEYVFEKLGMNSEMLDKWVHGHVDCSLRSISVGLSLHVMYQRKSGDSTTAFGNVILNVLSVAYAYRGTVVDWAVFMGDDSIVCSRAIVADDVAVQTLAEIFNLSAKYYVTQAPYFASNFILIDEGKLTVKMCPDVVKRIERLSMHVSADDPLWDERYESFVDSMSTFRDESVVQQLAVAVPQRYEVSEGLVRGAAGALGTLLRDKTKFRSLWAETPQVVQA